MSEEFGKQLVLYKPRTSGDGAASQWSLGSKRDCVFLEMANQAGKDDSGNARFDWGNKLKFKLGIADISELLLVLSGEKLGVGPVDQSTGKGKGLYHSNPSGDAVLYFGKDDKMRYNIYLSVRKDGKKYAVKHIISSGEIQILGILLRKAVETIYGWN